MKEVEIEEAVAHTKKRKKKKRLFKLAAMEVLVDQNSFLKSRYEKMSVDAEEKLGYHYNETIHNILFNKYVKTDEKLMDKYMTIRKNVELEQSRDKKDDKRMKKTNTELHPAVAGEQPEAEASAPAEQPAPEGDIAPVKPEQDFEDPDAPLDTRVVSVNEMDTGSAGDYSYETPFFMHKGSVQSWEAKWSANNKKSSNNMKVVKPKNQSTMGDKANKIYENILTNPDMVDSLFEDYFGVEPEASTELVNEDKLPDTAIQVKRVQAETEKESKSYYKKAKEASSTFEGAGASGGEDNALKAEDIPMHRPSEDQEEFVKLDRGGNLMDRTLQGLDFEPDDKTKARWKEQAGDKAYKDAEEEKKRVEKLKPELAPAARVKDAAPINESINLTCSYKDWKNKNNYVTFDANKAEVVESINEGMQRLEAKGIGNYYNESARTLIESHDFYIDLTNDKVYKVDSKTMLNESVSVAKTDISKMKHLMGYSPYQYVKGR